jgi:hypothetical protein
MPDDLEAFDNVEVSEVGPSSLPSQADVDRAALKAALERLTALEKRVDELTARVQGISAVDQALAQLFDAKHIADEFIWVDRCRRTEH